MLASTYQRKGCILHINICETVTFAKLKIFSKLWILAMKLLIK